MPESQVLLVVTHEGDQLVLLDAVSDSKEIDFLKKAFHKIAVDHKAPDLLKALDAYRIVKDREEELFGDHIESLLCKPFLKPKVRANCLDWLKSRAKMEALSQREREATRVIGEYAYKILITTPKVRDFTLASPKAEVHVEVLEV